MRSLVVLQNSAGVGLERFAGPLQGVPHSIVRLDRGEPVPEVSEIDALIVLGGHQGAYDEDEFPFLADEKKLLPKLGARGVPALGICLGCQLMADALGGRAYPAPTVEARFEPSLLTAAGRADLVVGHLAEPTLSLHEDTWDLPPGATLLATSPQYNQAFRLGTLLGVQTHPEVSVARAAEWVDDLGRDRIAATGVDTDDLIASFAAADAASDALSDRMLTAWLEEAGLVLRT